MLLALSLALTGQAEAAPTHAGLEAASWTVVTTTTHKDVGEITISKATVAGVECYRGTTTTDLPPQKLLSVVADINGSTRWSTAGLTEARLLNKVGNRIEYYQYLDVPGWTMSSDRFWFLSSTLEDTPTRAALYWEKLEDGGPHKGIYAEVKANHPDAVEPTVNVGSWIFEDKGGTVAVRYSICTQPGGSIPLAIQNAATRKTLPNTIGDVIREARSR